MSELRQMSGINWLVETRQESQSLARNACHHHAPVSALPPTGNKAALLHAVENKGQRWPNVARHTTPEIPPIGLG